MAGSSAFGTGIIWQIPPSREMIPKLALLNARMHLKLLRNAALLAQRLENEAKAMAPWTDRTGIARGDLFSNSSASGDGVMIVLGYGENTISRGYPYGIALETHNGGRFAIVMPTLERHYGTALAEITLNIMSY
jgi:hypothetical protein